MPPNLSTIRWLENRLYFPSLISISAISQLLAKASQCSKAVGYLGDHPKPAIDDRVKSGHRETA
jgi:hypothetical protein